MTNEETYTKLSQVFHDVFDDDSLRVTAELTANDVAEWDSLNHMRLIIAVEKQFGLKFSAAEVQRLANVGQFVALIQSKSAA